MPWIKSCLCHQVKKRSPEISSPIQLLLTPEATNSNGSNHTFRCKVFKKPRPCHLCHQPILHQGSCCRVCKYVCHKVCESKEAADRFSDTSWQIHRQWHSERTVKSSAPPNHNNNNSNTPNPNPNETNQFKRSNSLRNGYILNNNKVNFNNDGTEVNDGGTKTETPSSVVCNGATKKLVEIQSVQTHYEKLKPRIVENKEVVVKADVIVHNHEEPTKNGPGINKHVLNTSMSCNGICAHAHGQHHHNSQQQALTCQPRSACLRAGAVPSTGGSMDLSYVTERIIAVWFPTGCSQHAFHSGHRQAAHMLQKKHADNYTVFNLSEPKRALRNEHKHVKEIGWSPRLAPPLERICSVCKQIECWLAGGQHRIAVLHVRGSKDKLGVVVAAYMHYSSICGNAEQALDRFSMKRFLEDNIGPLQLPSNRRYVDYFAGLLSHNIKINTAPLYLTHVTVLGAPSIQNGGCRAFLKLYEGQTPVYTSGVYTVSSGVNQFTVNVMGEKNRGLQLRGDILVKCYHRGDVARETIFSCQFHTCAVADYTLCFTKQELDGACNDPRFAADGAIELHFSACAESQRRPVGTPAPTPAVPCASTTDDPVTRADTPLDAAPEELSDESRSDSDSDDVNHTFGPLDGSIYATVAKKPELSPGAVSSPLTVSMDSGISSAGHQQNSNTNNASPTTSGGTGHSSSGAPDTASTSQQSPEDNRGAVGQSIPVASSNGNASTVNHHHELHRQHRELDDLLADMMQTVQSLPDVGGKHTGDLRSPATPGTPGSHVGIIRYIDDESGNGDHDGTTLDEKDIPYHARQDSRPFSYGVGATAAGLSSTSNSTPIIVDSRHKNPNVMIMTDTKSSKLSSPSLVRKTILNKSSDNNTLSKIQTQVYPEYSTSLYYNNKPSYKPSNSNYDTIDNIFTEDALRASQREQPVHRQVRDEYYRVDHRKVVAPEPLKRSYTESTLRRMATQTSDGGYRSTSVLGVGSGAFSDSESLSPPHAFRSESGVRSPEFHEGHTNGGTLTWLQTQQQKLRERQDSQLRKERQPYESRLMSELRSTQQTRNNHYHQRPTASHRLDGYTSDTTAFADDDDDFRVPLHINTRGAANGAVGSGSGVGGGGGGTRYVNRSDSVDGCRERPFVNVKRAHAQNADMSPATALAANPFGQIVREQLRTSHTIHQPTPPPPPSTVSAQSTSANSADNSGLLSMVDKQRYNNTVGIRDNHYTDEDGAAIELRNSTKHGASYSSARADALTDLIANLSNTSGRASNSATVAERSATAALNAVGGDTSNCAANPIGIADKCTVASASLSANTSCSNQSSACHQFREDTSYTTWRSNDVDCSSPYSVTSSTPSRPQTPAFPVARTPYTNTHSISSGTSGTPTVQFDLPPKSPTTQRKDQPISPHANQQHVTHNGGAASTPDYYHSRNNTYAENMAPRSAGSTGSAGAVSPYGNSRRSSVHSNSEPPQEVSPAHVKFVRDTSRFWYKPTISRDDAITMIRDREPGTFLVRDSNSFAGAFGLALKVASLPSHIPSTPQRTGTDELVRHFLIEPTARGVRLKGCTNEPVFSSLSALVYQHSLTQLAFPCRLLLPEGDLAPSGQDQQTLRNTQYLQQGAACNVLYLLTVDMESLTGPAAIAKAMRVLFEQRKDIPKTYIVHFKVNVQGITLTDNKRLMFFRKHYPVATVSFCAVDADLRTWRHGTNANSKDAEGTAQGLSIFGFIAKKHASHSDNQCHLFAELEPQQPATAIVNFVNRVLSSTGSKLSNIL